MKRYVSGLSQASASPVEGLPDGLFLVRIERAQYRWHAQKPYYALVFSALEPKALAGNRFIGRLYCSPKALWKLNWFLRDSATTMNCSTAMRSTTGFWSDCQV